jgi:thioredoxin-like negative regulator of GroEL
MNTPSNRFFSLVLAGILLTAFLPALAGCGQSKPTLISFMGNSSESAKGMKPIVDKLKKKYKGKVLFIDVNMDDKKNKDMIDRYHVTMNPTFIIKNTKGQVKETFMGSAQEEMLMLALESFIPSTQKPQSSATNAMPPGEQAPPGVAPTSSSVQTVPATPTP